MPDRIAQLLGVTALVASERLRASVDAESGHGGSASAALVHLQAYPGETIESLRQVLGISQPATVRLVTRLEAEGVVVRRPGPDRRTVAVHLTAAGEESATRLLEQRAQSLSALLDVLEAAERAQLEPLLEKLVASFAGDRPGALRVCRLCDRDTCQQDPGCPLNHTVED